MALGLLICGYDAISSDKVKVDLAFSGAWRSWTYRNRFPQVDTDMRSLDGMRVMTRADYRKQTRVLFWGEEDRHLQIYTRLSDWTVDDDEDLEFAVGIIDEDVPAGGWEELAREFVTRFMG